MKLGKKELALLRLAGGGGELHAADWKRFVPLSNKGLVDIGDEPTNSVFGHRKILVTEKGREVLRAALRGDRLPTKDERAILLDLTGGPIGPTHTRTGRPFVQCLEALVDLGYAKAHRASIGELDEHATFSITEKGRDWLDRSINEKAQARRSSPRE